MARRTASSTASRRSSPRPPRTPGGGRSSSSSATADSALRGLDVEDLVLQGSSGRGHLDDLALLPADDRAADGRLVRELLLSRIGLGGADDPVLDRLVRVHVLQAHARPDADDLRGLARPPDHPRTGEPLLDQGDPLLEAGLLVLRVQILLVLGELAACVERLGDPLGDLAAAHRTQLLDLVLELLHALGREEDFLLGSGFFHGAGTVVARIVECKHLFHYGLETTTPRFLIPFRSAGKRPRRGGARGRRSSPAASLWTPSPCPTST